MNYADILENICFDHQEKKSHKTESCFDQEQIKIFRAIYLDQKSETEIAREQNLPVDVIKEYRYHAERLFLNETKRAAFQDENFYLAKAMEKQIKLPLTPILFQIAKLFYLEKMTPKEIGITLAYKEQVIQRKLYNINYQLKKDGKMEHLKKIDPILVMEMEFYKNKQLNTSQKAVQYKKKQ